MFVLMRAIFYLVAFCLCGTSLFGQSSGDIQFSEKQEAVDMDALRRWLLDRRLVTLKEKGGDFSMSGEVRTEGQVLNEKLNGIKQRGAQSATGKPIFPWDVEVNLMFDYRTDRTWTAIKLEFDNDMGMRSGTVNHIRLEKAYFGGRLIPGDTFTFDAEIGRRYLVNVFDSRVEFGSLFDGVLLRFNKAFQSIGDYYFNAGSFLVDDKSNHYAFVAEMGMLSIGKLGLNAKYSLIDWRKHFSYAPKNMRYRFLVQQFLVSYQWTPEWIGKRLIKLYAAGVNNLIAKAVDITDYRKQNWGWYSGISIGQVRKMGDWAIDANYQWVQAQVVPDFDSIGIGRGNAGGVGLYTKNIDGSGEPTTRATAVGSNNFKGFEVEVLYAFTDNITILQNFKMSSTLNKEIGPNMRYKQFEIEFIYAF